MTDEYAIPVRVAVLTNVSESLKRTVVARIHCKLSYTQDVHCTCSNISETVPHTDIVATEH